MSDFNLKKCAIVLMWFDGKVMLCKRKKGYYRDLYGGAGGKIEANERIDIGLSREIQEECGVFVLNTNLILTDCYIVPRRNKVFIFEAINHDVKFSDIKCTEPEKHGEWKLFSIKEALKLDLTPYLREYFESK